MREVFGLHVFWITLPEENRDEFANALRQASGGWSVVPVILRTPGLFRDPNAVMNDVTSILHDVKDDIMAMVDCTLPWNGVDLVLLSRSELRLAVTSSPLLLPEWFPVMPGQTVSAYINDLTWSVLVRLSDGVVELNDLRRILYELDKALLARIQETRKADHRQSQALWDRIRRQDENDVELVLEGIDTRLRGITNPADFRPSTSRSPTITW